MRLVRTDGAPQTASVRTNEKNQEVSAMTVARFEKRTAGAHGGGDHGMGASYERRLVTEGVTVWSPMSFIADGGQVVGPVASRQA